MRFLLKVGWMNGVNEFLKWAIFGPFGIVIVVIGWIWNIIIIVTLIKNKLPIGYKIAFIACWPWMASLYFVGVGITWAILFFKNFYKEDYESMTSEQVEMRLRSVLG